MPTKITWCTECGDGLKENGNCPDDKCSMHFEECPHARHKETCVNCYDAENQKENPMTPHEQPLAPTPRTNALRSTFTDLNNIPAYMGRALKHAEALERELAQVIEAATFDSHRAPSSPAPGVKPESLEAAEHALRIAVLRMGFTEVYGRPIGEFQRALDEIIAYRAASPGLLTVKGLTDGLNDLERDVKALVEKISPNYGSLYWIAQDKVIKGIESVRRLMAEGGAGEAMRLTDAQWTNIINFEHGYQNFDKDEAVQIAVKKTVDNLNEIYRPLPPQPTMNKGDAT